MNENAPSPAGPWHARVSWPMIAALATIALVRPLLSITGRADDWGRPATPLIATAVVTAIWISAVVVTRTREPLLSLLVTGVTYGVLAVVLSGVLSPILDGELRGPVVNPFAAVGVLAVNALWGALAGLVAAALSSWRNRGRVATSHGG